MSSPLVQAIAHPATPSVRIVGGAPVPVAAILELCVTARLFYGRGWALGTSGNYSVVLRRDPLRLLITASGRDKRRMGDEDFVVVDDAARPFDPNGARPSAETALHTMLAQDAGIGAVLHTHSIWNTVLSDRYFADGELVISGYEMLKGLAGITTHAARVRIPIFENSQDVPALAAQVRTKLRGGSDGNSTNVHAFLLRGHGLYTWGVDLAEARRHVEILEFLFEVVGRRLSMPPG